MKKLQLITDKLILIPFTRKICENILLNDFTELDNLGLKKGIKWPDAEILDTLPRIIKNLSKLDYPTGFESWMIIKKDTKEIIGDAGFKGVNRIIKSTDIGYGIIEAERRKGYAEEAVKALINWAFENEDLEDITASCYLDNIGSKNLLEKLNFEEIERNDEFIYWLLPLNSKKNIHL
ncbi:GNAT family N-acetyltransferase [Faecalibacter rhinopitheci]|uniref:GNAT family N-acetyltransferase n=1 Tax=Faecalibacter rhinopitheci TaxID=2779678 RepID=A0A8J7FV66_9FLAO|nr:GNAT family N-acetyltransferase [Faecalibacter rhinopitheci]MBF0596028.1 GNAT family N-acetyltransferase [Faecalibacter rhinopitheci]